MFRIGIVLALLGGIGFWLLTSPGNLPEDQSAQMASGDALRGETIFWAGGCASCHADEKAKGEERLQLGGGLLIKTPVGNFSVPNISMDQEDGIGAWSGADFANAMLLGVSPDGQHYYPSFPYTSFARMETGDVADLWAYFQTLPAVAGNAPSHDLSFPFSVRRGLGLWKLAFFSDAEAISMDTADPIIARGKYLVEGPGHCGECHTPRNLGNGTDYSRWLGGGPEPDGPGKIPNITGGKGGIGDWSAEDIAYYLESGFKPDFDTVGGSMVEVQENMAMLTPDDRMAIAQYLKAVPAVDG